jgi:hypothetical protein
VSVAASEAHFATEKAPSTTGRIAVGVTFSNPPRRRIDDGVFSIEETVFILVFCNFVGLPSSGRYQTYFFFVPLVTDF